MTTMKEAGRQCLSVDAAQETEHIGAWVRECLGHELRRRGVVVGISGGVDSSVVAALCTRALGPRQVLGVLMPERDSDPESLRLGREVAESLKIETVVEDIGPMLEAMGCYRRRDEFIRQVFPDYGQGWKCKIVLTGQQAAAYNLFALVVESPEGEQRRVRLPYAAYLGIVAATNMKQRMRKQLEYYHADRLNYAVAGAPNRLECELGLFVKNGDGAADLKPIAHLYKSQVYELGEHLGLPREILQRPPTTDTYSLPQTQEEFYFTVPYQEMDVCLYAVNHGLPAEWAAEASGLSQEQVRRVQADIAGKRRVAHYLHLPPQVVASTTRA